MKVFKHYGAALCSLFVLLLPACGWASNLRQVVIETLQSNPQITAAAENTKALHQVTNEARSGLLPSVSVSASLGREHSENPAVRAFRPLLPDGSPDTTVSRKENRLKRRETNLTINQVLFDGGSLRHTVSQRRYQEHVGDLLSCTLNENLALQTIEAYINVLRSWKLIEIARKNVAVHKNTLHKIRKRFRAGAGRRVEIQLALSRLALAKSRLNTFLGQQRQSASRFMAVTGHTVPYDLEVPHVPVKLLPHSFKHALDVTMQENPELQRTRAELAASHEGIRVAKATFYPRLDLQVTATRNKNLDGIEGSNNDAQAMFVASYNLFRGGGDLARVRQAKSRAIEAHERILNAERLIAENLENSWEALITAHHQVKRLDNYVKHSRLVVRDYKIEFSLGKRALFNVLDAENELFNARTSLANSRYDKAIEVYRVLATMGKLSNYLYFV